MTVTRAYRRGFSVLNLTFKTWKPRTCVIPCIPLALGAVLDEASRNSSCSLQLFARGTGHCGNRSDGCPSWRRRPVLVIMGIADSVKYPQRAQFCFTSGVELSASAPARTRYMPGSSVPPWLVENAAGELTGLRQQHGLVRGHSWFHGFLCLYC